MSAGVVICGGGTGGHINPGLAVAAELREMGIAVDWLGTKGGMEERLVPEAGLPLHTVRFAAPKGGLAGLAACLARLVPAALAARKVLRGLDARVVLGMGGYPSLPGVFAALGGLARRLVHEQNVVPGLANRLLAPLAHGVLTSHPGTLAKHGPQLTGNPVAGRFAGIPEPAERFKGREGRLRLLVIGGSQGARALNEGVPNALKGSDRWSVEHAAGESSVESTRGAYESAGVTHEVGAYFGDVDRRMADADLVVCRAGAATVAEIACVGAASILVPYPHARSHQRKNAAALVESGAALVLDDAKAADGKVLAKMLADLSDRGRLLEMAENARKGARPDAAREVALACGREMERGGV